MAKTLYLDAITCKVRDQGVVGRKAAYLAVGIDSSGYKDVLGIWIDQAEGAKFWLKSCNELANRGVEDVIFVCVDGLTGLPEAIESVWPNAIVRTCVVHLVRGSTRYASWRDRKAITAALKEIYQAPNEDAALDALERFEQRYAERYPAIGKLWRDAWDRFVPMLDYPPEIRRVLYTTNSVESLNYQLRKFTRNRATSRPTTPCSSCSTSAYATSSPSNANPATAAPPPWAGKPPSTSPASSSPDASTSPDHHDHHDHATRIHRNADTSDRGADALEFVTTWATKQPKAA